MLDAASLFQVFLKLDGCSLAKCSCVSKTWQNVARSEFLWQHLCPSLEHEQLFRHDILEGLNNSYRQYYSWSHPRRNCRVNRLCILNNDGQGHTRLALTEVSQPGVGPGGSSGTGERYKYVPRDTTHIAAPTGYMGGNASKPTWSPVGGLLAYSAMQPGRMAVVVVDCCGRPVSQLVLDSPPLPVIYLHWAPCGTRLLMLNVWLSGVERIALRVWDLGRELLSRHLAGRYPSLGLPGGGARAGESWMGPAGRSDVAGARREEAAGKPVLLGTSQPLFLTCSPSSTRVLWHGAMRHYSLVDCATVVDEDGQEHDRFFSNAEPGGVRVPQWIRDGRGAEHLLLSVVLEQAQHAQQEGEEDVGNDGLGELLLVPVAALEEAYEMEGSVLSTDLLRSMATKVALIRDIHNCSCEANVDGSMVAWTEASHLFVRFMAGGEQPYRLQLLPLRAGRWQPVLAMQWAPDGGKLLLLTLEGNDWHWVVWHPPPTPPPAHLAPGQLQRGQLGCLMLGPPHRHSTAFQSEYLPFFDQYTQSMRVWSPDSRAFCYPAIDAPTSETALGWGGVWVGMHCVPSAGSSLTDVGRESSYIFVQGVPTPEQLQATANSEGGGSSAAGTPLGQERDPSGPPSGSSPGGREGGGGLEGVGLEGQGRGGGGRRRGGGGRGWRVTPDLVLEEAPGLGVFPAPAPSRIMPGKIATWSWT